MALRMIAAVTGVSVPVHRSIGRDLEGRVSVLVEIFTVLGFDGRGIGRVLGTGNSSGCQEDDRGSHKPDCTQELVPRHSVAVEPAHGPGHAPERGWYQLTAAARTPSGLRRAR